MDFIVLYKGGSGEGAHWDKIGNTWWVKAPTKWSTKAIYTEIVQHFVRQGRDVRVYLDDEAPGHGAQAIDHFLATLTPPCRRVRIQGGCTWVLQPADRPETNGVLKRVLADLMHTHQIEELLKAEFTGEEFETHGSLTAKARQQITGVLDAARRHMNTADRQAKTRQAFTETVLPGGKKHSQLQEFMAEAEKLVAQSDGTLPVVYGKRPRKHKCEFQCGAQWTTNKSNRSYTNHHRVCWFQRTRLFPPLRHKAVEADTGLDRPFALTGPTTPEDCLVVRWGRQGTTAVLGPATEEGNLVMLLPSNRAVVRDLTTERTLQYREPTLAEADLVALAFSKFALRV
jgi:hypothetical protein